MTAGLLDVIDTDLEGFGNRSDRLFDRRRVSDACDVELGRFDQVAIGGDECFAAEQHAFDGFGQWVGGRLRESRLDIPAVGDPRGRFRAAELAQHGSPIEPAWSAVRIEEVTVRGPAIVLRLVGQPFARRPDP